MSDVISTDVPFNDDTPDIQDICDALNILAKKLGVSDAKIVLAAAYELRRAQPIWNDLDYLASELAEIEKTHQGDLAKHPNAVGLSDLAASILALDAICQFFRARIPNDIMYRLLNGLRDLSEGGPPAAMFLPLERPKGRRPDPPMVMAAKGILAGVMHRKQLEGLSRQAAAKWIVQHVSPMLAAQISGKPLTARMVEEWLDRFGGRHAEKNLGRKTFLIYSRKGKLTAAQFRKSTELVAREFLGKKPR
jgi:hypothetical protein